MSMKFELIEPKESDIFRVLDDDVFWGELDKATLEGYRDFASQSDIDEFVGCAIRRALEITMPDDTRLIQWARGKKK